MTDICTICGRTLPYGRRKYCCDACAAQARRDRDRDQYTPTGKPRSVYAQRTCRDCGAIYTGHIKTIRCPDCQAEADRQHDAEHKRRKRAGHARTLGSTDLCSVCGKPYTVASSNQRYCPDCREAAWKAADRALSRAWNRAARSDPAKRKEIISRKRRSDPMQLICNRCGKTYLGNGAHSSFCSGECRAAHRAEYYAAYDAARADQKREYNRQRNAALTPEQRAEVNRKARENYAKRKARKEDNPMKSVYRICKSTTELDIPSAVEDALNHYTTYSVLYSVDSAPSIIAEYDNESTAREAFDRYSKTSIDDVRSSAGQLLRVTEYYIEHVEFNADGEQIERDTLDILTESELPDALRLFGATYALNRSGVSPCWERDDDGEEVE